MARHRHPATLRAFRDWLAQRYQAPDALTRYWTNVFWSMGYADFNEIALPNLTVTEANPAHLMVFCCFACDEVVAFNHLQTEIIRRHSAAPIAHNYIGQVTDPDHFATVQPSISQRGMPVRWAFRLPARRPPMKTACALSAKASPTTKPFITTCIAP